MVQNRIYIFKTKTCTFSNSVRVGTTGVYEIEIALSIELISAQNVLIEQGRHFLLNKEHVRCIKNENLELYQKGLRRFALSPIPNPIF